MNQFNQKNCNLITFSLCLVFHLYSQPALAKASNNSFKLEVSIGGQYDSNIVVEELDVQTTENDVAFLLGIDADYKRSLAPYLDLNVGYSFSESFHSDLQQFDTRNQLLLTGMTYDIDNKTSIGINLNVADSTLDGDGFLSLMQWSPFTGHYLSKRLFIRGALAVTDKKFDGRSSRNTDARGANIDLYYFIDGPKNYLISGYKYKQEESQLSRFNYDAKQVKLRWVKRLEWMGKRSKLKLGWRFEQRQYDKALGSTGMKREDDRQRFSASFKIPLKDNTSLLLEYQYRDYRSNRDSADYSEHVSAINLQHRFF